MREENQIREKGGGIESKFTEEYTPLGNAHSYLLLVTSKAILITSSVTNVVLGVINRIISFFKIKNDFFQVILILLDNHRSVSLEK